MSTSTVKLPVPGSPAVTLPDKNWVVLFRTIERAVKELKRTAFIKRDKPAYISVWNDFAIDANDIIDDNASATFHDTTGLLTDDPQTFYDFGQSLLELVPPVREVITIQTKTRNTILLSVLKTSTDIMELQAAAHDKLFQSDDDSTLSGLRRHVADLDAQFQKTINGDDLNKRITKMIETELPTVVKAAVKELTSTQAEFQQVATDSAKLRGDVQNLNNEITNLRSVCTTLQNTATEATEVHRKHLSTFAQDVQNITAKSLQAIEEKVVSSPQKETPLPSIVTEERFYSQNPDDYIINGTKVSVRSKKFLEDKTRIQCDSAEEIITTYDHFCSIASQYGIMLTPSHDIELWTNPDLEPIPPTFPYQHEDFKNTEEHDRAYNMMSHSILTKLCDYVTFGPSFNTVQYIVHQHEKDGYRMMYNLLKVSHPRLTHNKAARPDRPTFDGDLPKLISKYRNFLAYEKERDNPRIYDLDEQTEDIILAIKKSSWYDQIKEGVKYAEEKLQLYKNHRFENGSAMFRQAVIFPHELKLEFLAQTIMQFYIDRNLNPLEASGTNNHMKEPPSIKRGYIPRGRSRDRHENRQFHRSRSGSPRSNSRRGSFDARSLKPCKICGGQHKYDTIGCPHFLRHYHMNRFMKSNSGDYIRNTVDSMEKQRSRSNSVDSHRSTNSHSARSATTQDPEHDT